jgi:hypothetical protein
LHQLPDVIKCLIQRVAEGRQLSTRSEILAGDLPKEHSVGKRIDQIDRLLLLDRIARILHVHKDVGVNGVHAGLLA